MEQQQKQYIGKGWRHPEYDLINADIKQDEIAKLTPDNYGCVRITIAMLKAQDVKSKATHTVYVNDYVPQQRPMQQQQQRPPMQQQQRPPMQQQQQRPMQQQQQRPPMQQQQEDDLPF